MIIKTDPLRSDNYHSDSMAWYRTIEVDSHGVCCVSRVIRNFPEVKDKVIRLCLAPRQEIGGWADIRTKAIPSFADYNISQYLTDLFIENNISHGQPIYWWVEEAL